MVLVGLGAELVHAAIGVGRSLRRDTPVSFARWRERVRDERISWLRRALRVPKQRVARLAIAAVCVSLGGCGASRREATATSTAASRGSKPASKRRSTAAPKPSAPNEAADAEERARLARDIAAADERLEQAYERWSATDGAEGIPRRSDSTDEKGGDVERSALPLPTEIRDYIRARERWGARFPGDARYEYEIGHTYFLYRHFAEAMRHLELLLDRPCGLDTDPLAYEIFRMLYLICQNTHDDSCWRRIRDRLRSVSCYRDPDAEPAWERH